MNISIIHNFINDQKYVIEMLKKKINLPDGVTGQDWAGASRRIQEMYNKDPFAKKFYIHGYGLEFEDDNVYIDFDFGSNGRYDGFDDWRLYMHITKGRPGTADPTRKLQKELDLWFQTLIDAGDVVRDYPLYYLSRS